MNFFSYFYSDKMALSMYRAQPVTREQLPRVFQIVERILPHGVADAEDLCHPHRVTQRGLPPGATRGTPAVAVTQGILNLLNARSSKVCWLHELGHVRNRDILTSSIAATLAGAIIRSWRTLAACLGGGRDDRRDSVGAAF